MSDLQTRDQMLSNLATLPWKLTRAVSVAEDRAGTLPAKDSVKVEPTSWHDLCDLSRKAAAEIARLQAALSEADQREKDARREALEEAAKVVDVAAEKTPWEQRRNSLRRAAKAIRALQSEER